MDMYAINQRHLKNVLLRALPDAAFARFFTELEAITLPARFRLVEQGKESGYVYFPEAGVASVVGQIGAEWQEIGLFGHDGAGSLSGVLTGSPAPYLIVMQVPGHGHRLPVAGLRRAFVEDPQVREVLMRYMQSFMIQVSQSCIANCQYNTVQRMARWFLMIHDRVDGDAIALTHEFIATMLGVGRTGVTLALHTLEADGLISTARKRIIILDRSGLERMTAGVYGFAEREYRKRFGGTALTEPSLSVAH